MAKRKKSAKRPESKPAPAPIGWVDRIVFSRWAGWALGFSVIAAPTVVYIMNVLGK